MAKIERNFMLDQRSARKMFIMGEDEEYSQIIENRLKRKRAVAQYLQRASTSTAAHNDSENVRISSSSIDSSTSTDSSPGIVIDSPAKKYNMVSLQKVPEIADRLKLNNSESAAMASAVAVDMGAYYDFGLLSHAFFYTIDIDCVMFMFTSHI